MKKQLFIITLFALHMGLLGCTEKKNITTTHFKVWGNCEMCKETIETSLKEDGISAAEWSQETKMIMISYEPSKIKEGQLHKLIAASGYDTEKEKAGDEAYEDLPKCCQYIRK